MTTAKCCDDVELLTGAFAEPADGASFFDFHARGEG
jgi:hypothetical protein